jgi:hypothetical protein
MIPVEPARSPRKIDNEVRLFVYRYFVENGYPPVAPEIARRLQHRPDEVEASLRRLADDHVLVLAPGTSYVWMASPLSALPTSFLVTSEGRRWWGNCIWDAMGVLSMLGSDGEVSTWCPDCGDELQISIAGGEPEHDDHVVHYAVPAAHWWDDIGFN